MTSPQQSDQAQPRYEDAVRPHPSQPLSGATLDALASHIAVVRARGEIVATNAAWRRFGRENGLAMELCDIGVNYLDVCKRAAETGCVEAARAADGIRDVLAGTRQEFEIEYPCHSSASQRWFILRACPLIDRQQQYALIEHQDITVRKMTEMALLTSEERFRAIFDEAGIGTVQCDMQGRIQHANRAFCELLGYRFDELRGMSLNDITGTEENGEAERRFRSMLASGARRYQLKRRYLRKDGMLCWGRFTMSMVREPQGEPRFLIGMLEDITDQIEMQSQLSQAERLAAVGELAAGVAHEVNNPLGTMINCAQLIKDGDDDPTLCDTIMQEGERIAMIVRNLLAFARGDRDALHSTSLPDVLDQTLSLVRESFVKHGIHVHVDWAEELPPIMTNPQQMMQVFLNLLINSKDALLETGHDGTRQIRVRGDLTQLHGSPAVRLEFRDNGPGVRPALLPRVFEPFVTSKRARGGTGLGLSISRKIISNHGGALEVDSAPGDFTEFRVILPVRTTAS